MVMEFRKDLHHNYMVISEADYSKEQAYSIKMLDKNNLEGILPLEPRSIDNRRYLYYDITAKQALVNLFVKASMPFDKVRQLFLDIINIIENAYEYLLKEDDFVLLPEYIFFNLSSKKVSLCYLPGYDRNIKEQMAGFIEFVMNKLDYSDKEAVILVYSLYACCKEEGFTFGSLRDILQPSDKYESNKDNKNNIVNRYNRDNKDIKENKDSRNNKDSKNNKDTKDYKDVKDYKDTKDYKDKKDYKDIRDNNNDNHLLSRQKMKTVQSPMIPVMMEKVTGEQELLCYPLKTYFYTAACAIGGILFLYIAIATGLVFNSLGTRLDFSKLFALLLILLCLEGYLLEKVWNKKNRLPKIVTKQEYIDPRTGQEVKTEQSAELQEYGNKDTSELFEACSEEDRSIPFVAEENRIESLIKEGIHNLPRSAEELRNVIEKHIDDDEESNPTCLLSDMCQYYNYILKPLDETEYETVVISGYPFFIGKLKKNVDYCLDKEVISRYHAKFTKEEDNYYLTDLNSTNGTFLNNEAIPPYQPKEIKQGDEIAFANIKYRFLMQ